MIAVVDKIGGSNLMSVTQALQRLSADWHLTSDPEEIMRADKVLLPGVGSAAAAMTALGGGRLFSTIRGLTQPVLGICLGMQLLFRRSMEGKTDCLGIINGDVIPFGNDNPGIRIPHMGWNTLNTSAGDNPLLSDVKATDRFYFVHSFHATEGPWVLATCRHGEDFAAVVRQDNFYGCQFHPEKSGAAGHRFLGNFLSL